MPDDRTKHLRGLVGLIYEAALEPLRWNDVMEQVARFYDGCAVLFGEDGERPEASVFGVGLFEPSHLATYQSHYIHTNVWTPLIEPLPTGEIFDSRVVPRETFERSEWYNGWLKPQDLYHSLGFVVANHDKLQTRFSILRSERAGEFDEDELRVWRMVGSHAQRAFQIHRQLQMAHLERDAARLGLDRLEVAAFITDQDGRVLSANSAGVIMLAALDGLMETEGKLAALMPDETDRLRGLIRRAVETAAGRSFGSGGVVVLHRGLKRPLSAVVSPMWGEALDAGHALPAALIFVRDPDRKAISRPQSLKTMFGLTDAEARIAAAMADGSSVEEISREAGITLATARTHLKRIMDKAKVKRQGELIALILKSVAAVESGAKM